MTAFILTLYQTERYDIYPIVPLGVYLSEVVIMYARDNHSWAYQKRGIWETIDMTGCMQYGTLGFVCEDHNFQQHNKCLYENINGTRKCSFEIRSESGLSAIYIGHGYVCLRTDCQLVHMDS